MKRVQTMKDLTKKQLDTFSIRKLCWKKFSNGELMVDWINKNDNKIYLFNITYKMTMQGGEWVAFYYADKKSNDKGMP